MLSKYLKPASGNTNNNDPPPRSPETAPGERSADRSSHNLPAARRLYAIIDSVTDTIVGGIQIHINHASAIRTLTDIALTEKTTVNMHPQDFDLWCLGHLSYTHILFPDKERILSGDQIAAIVNNGADTNA